ncbi:MAG: RsmB/NOP family class I SAM-dependent RNA methyltransferase [Rhodobacteraceae bacterium]|nr:RsmB/NOP family class I SAM-dependent RNA methyltransferase [Paracoccaceae bacterium]
MTPAARLQAAIEVLDEVRRGVPADKALTGWARRSRFAGSKDRAALRDHVFDVLRRRRSVAALGGGEDGRALILGALRADDTDPDTVFGAPGYAPAPLTPDERSGGRPPQPGAEAADLPDWLWPLWCESLGEAAAASAEVLRHRAPVFLRVNLHRGGRDAASAALAAEGIETRPHALSPTALEVTNGARRIHLGAAYGAGLIELQDASSQAVVDALPQGAAGRILDYCAGGGGKALAIAARFGAAVHVHDADPGRMRDLPRRAARGGHRLETVANPAPGAYDLVLCDAPCSGSGAWRRAPEGKWMLSAERLDALTRLQAQILDRAAELVAPGGVLAYATCSVLAPENDHRIVAFCARHPEWVCTFRRNWPLTAGADGFFTAHLMRAGASGAG